MRLCSCEFDCYPSFLTAAEKKHLAEIESLKAKSVAESDRADAKYETRDAKYRRLKKKLLVIVSNLTKEAMRTRNRYLEEQIGILCSQHNIPFPDYEFEDLGENEETSEISDIDVEYETDDEDDEVEEGHNSEDGEDNADPKYIFSFVLL